jgi:hypothetical protein
VKHDEVDEEEEGVIFTEAEGGVNAVDIFNTHTHIHTYIHTYIRTYTNKQTNKTKQNKKKRTR